MKNVGQTARDNTATAPQVSSRHEALCQACGLVLTPGRTLQGHVVCAFCFREKALTGDSWEEVGKRVREADVKGWLGTKMKPPVTCEICRDECVPEPVMEFETVRWLCKECRAV